MIVIVLTSIVLFLACMLYFVLRKVTHPTIIPSTSYNSIKVLHSVVVPTIINEQSYFYTQTKYTNMKFAQVIRSNDYVSNLIKTYGTWPECQDIYNIYLTGKREGVFVDFGANIGSCSFVFAQAGVKVYAFEPLPNNLFPFTVTTFSNPDFSKLITIYPYALGKREENQTMRITKTNWGFSSLHYKHTDYTESIHVKMLDEFDTLIPTKISMIKIDVEAAEYDLLEGGKEFFKTHKTEFIHMEADCGRKDANGKYEIERMFKILNDMGYEIIRKFDCTKTSKDNIVARRK